MRSALLAEAHSIILQGSFSGPTGDQRVTPYLVRMIADLVAEVEKRGPRWVSKAKENEKLDGQAEQERERHALLQAAAACWAIAPNGFSAGDAVDCAAQLLTEIERREYSHSPTIRDLCANALRFAEELPASPERLQIIESMQIAIARLGK